MIVHRASPVLAVLLCALAAAPATVRGEAARSRVVQSDLSGEWLVRPTDTPGRVHLTLMRDQNGMTSSPIALQRLEGLTPAAMSAQGGTVRFRLRREAGTFDFEGWFRDGRGSGHWDFTPDQRFADELDRRGIGRPLPREQLSLGVHDVGLALVDELRRQGYPTPTVAGLVRAGQHGAGMEFLRGMGALGYRFDSLEELVRIRDHGAGPEFARELAAEGYRDLPAGELVRLRDHGVNPDFIHDLRELGYARLSTNELVRMRDHGVTPAFIRRANAGGSGRLAVDELVRMRDRGWR